MSSLPPEVMAELQREYVAAFPEKVAAITSAVQKRDWKAVESVFHKMAGSGATYKMPEVTAVARALENYLKNHQAPDRIFGEGLKLFMKVLEGRKTGAPVAIDAENDQTLKALAA